MRKPTFGKPRPPSAAFSLSRTLPRLQLPLSAAGRSVPRPHPVVGRPGHAAAAPALPQPLEPGEAACHRCGHGELHHPTRYVCDKYPHPDPLQICGCEAEHVEEVCSSCGHKARSHKARHRCRANGCLCWGFDHGDREATAGAVC